MSDTRAAIRELRSLSEKRSTQGLSIEERVRLDELRQRLGLPPEPELAPAVPAAAPVPETTAPGVRRPSLAERIEAAEHAEDPGAAPAPVSSPPAEATAAPAVNGTAPGQARAPASEMSRALPPLPTFGSPEPLAAPLPDLDLPTGATAPAPSLPAAPIEHSGEDPAVLYAGESMPPPEAPSVSAPMTPAEETFPAADGDLEPPPFAAESLEAAPGFDPADASADALSGFLDSPDAPAEVLEAAPGFLDPAATSAEATESAPGFSDSTDALAFLTPDATSAETTAHLLEDAGAPPAAELPADGPLPGDSLGDGFGAEPLPPESDPGAAAPALAAEDGYGAEPLTPAPEPGLLPPDAPLGDSSEPILGAEDLGATPLDVLPPEDVPVRSVQESGPIELSAADVMLLDDDGRHDVSGLELGGDASEPLQLAGAHDFVQYQRQDEGAIALEPSTGDEGLGDPALLQASEAELATAPSPFVPPPAAPSLRVPQPPPTSAPLPRSVTAPSMPAPRAAMPVPLVSVPSARAPVPPPARAAPRPEAVRPPPASPPPSARTPPPPPSSAVAPAPLRLTQAVPPAAAPRAVTPAPAAAARAAPAFPVLTQAPPTSTASPPVSSGPFARPPPSLMPSAPLDTMDPEPVIEPAAPPEPEPASRPRRPARSSAAPTSAPPSSRASTGWCSTRWRVRCAGGR